MKALISSAQDLTNAWADLGDPVKMANRSTCGLWINLDINATNNARVRALAQLDQSGTLGEFFLPIKTVSTSDIKVQDEYIEFNDDADQKMILEVETNNLIPWLQFQVMAGTVGATAGQIDTAYATFDNF